MCVFFFNSSWRTKITVGLIDFIRTLALHHLPNIIISGRLRDGALSFGRIHKACFSSILNFAIE